MKHVSLDAVLIAGPTASGKSSLALKLAERTGGIVVNVDSMQVYRDLRILTARPTLQEEAVATHCLYGFVDGVENFSVLRWLEALRSVLAQAQAAGQLPILVGGSGLYFRAALEGLSAIPPVPEDVRSRVRAEAVDQTTAALHRRLAQFDPKTAQDLVPNDRQRILRALEVVEATGQSIRDFQGKREAGLIDPHRSVRLFLHPDRAWLTARIDRRFHEMIEAGAMKEVEQLAERRLDPALPVMRAHGVPALIASLRGEIALDAAIAKGQADTRAYAKRQVTWFRHQMEGWLSSLPEEGETVLQAALRA